MSDSRYPSIRTAGAPMVASIASHGRPTLIWVSHRGWTLKPSFSTRPTPPIFWRRNWPSQNMFARPSRWESIPTAISRWKSGCRSRAVFSPCCRHPVTIVTKSALIIRDLDLLTDLAKDRLVSVMVSVTSLTNDIKRTLEPRTASPQARLRVIQQLSEAGVPVGVLVAPVIPAITDHEIEDIMAAAHEAGASRAGYVLLRLPHELKIIFRDWLAQHYPDRAKHVMSLINQSRGGKDYDSQFGTRMRGTGPYAELLRTRFELAKRKLGFAGADERYELDTSLFRPPIKATPQLSLF